MEKIIGIVVSVSNYKNNDAVINILTEDRLLGVLARGSLNIKNKTNQFIKPFIYGEFDLYKGGTGGYKLRDCKVYNYFSEDFKTYDDLMICDFLSELVFKFLIENDDVSGYLKLLIDVLSRYGKSEHKYALISYFYAQLLKLSGYGLNLNSCVKCQNTSRIVGIDFDEGGVVCDEHVGPFTKLIKKEEYEIYKKMFDGNIDSMESIELTKEQFLDIILNLNMFMSKNLGFNLKSINILKTL